MSSSKVCLVTGSTSGIGFETAKALAEKDWTVVLHGRDKLRGKAALAKIWKETGNDSLDLVLADFSSLDEVRRMARDFKKKYKRLDVLVNNAATWPSGHRMSRDGFEIAFAVNYLAHFVLTNKLLPLLKRSKPSRIVNVASRLHGADTIDFEAVRTEKGIGGMRAYKHSKLAIILFTYELADRLKDSGVTVNCLHPGVVRTRLNREYPILGKLWEKLPLLKSPKSGAETSVYLATSPDVNGVTGKYFINKKESKSSKTSRNLALRKQLWRVSAELTGIKD